MNGMNMPVSAMLYEPPGPKTKKIINVITAVSVVLLVYFAVIVVRRFYDTGQLDERYWSFFAKYTTWKFLAKGLLGTLEAAVVAGAVTFIGGFFMMTARISGIKILKMLSTALIEFTRGVPTLLFIYFFFLIAPQYGIKLPPLWKIALPVAISASGVVAEALRSGVNAVPAGQREAALSLGLRGAQVFLKIIFPQAMRFVIPALIAELVIVVKDTTFAYVVNFPDLMQNAKVLISNYDSMLSVYLLVAVIYIIINYLLNKASVAAYHRLNDVRKMR
ncbi:MAG: amino acid ABC transporter permease [Lachnospiraceae bacterium]|nr:amino acid ABC transporter permease [Lachnospiraceae bacterium]